jgi:hypothetical protein
MSWLWFWSSSAQSAHTVGAVASGKAKYTSCRYHDIVGDGGSRVLEQVAERRARIADGLAGVRHLVAVGSGDRSTQHLFPDAERFLDFVPVNESPQTSVMPVSDLPEARCTTAVT